MSLTGLEKAVLMLLSFDEGPASLIVAKREPAGLRRLREVAVMMGAVPTMPLDEELHEACAGMLLDGLFAVST